MTVSLNFPRNSVELLHNADNYQNDAYFLTARYEVSGDTVTIHIDQNCPIAVNDAQVRDQINKDHGIHFPTLKEARAYQGLEGCLISGGGYLWVRHNNQDRMVLSRRNGGAALGQLCNQSGMASELPDLTIKREFVEELGLIIREYNVFNIIAFDFNDQRISAKHVKKTQLSTIKQRLADKGYDVSKFELVVKSVSAQEHEPDISKKNNIVVFIDDDRYEFKSQYCFEQEHNTLALRESYLFDASEYSQDSIVVVDPEEFNCETALYTTEDMKKDTLVEALRYYLA